MNSVAVGQGTLERFVLWDPVDLGYLAAYAAVASAKGEIEAGATTFDAGRLGSVQVAGDEIILGDPTVFDASNVDDFDF